VLFRADGVAHRSVRVRLDGNDSNRSGLGARVTVTSGGESQTLELKSGAGYLSESELALTFGLGNRARADQIVVVWPSGVTDRIDLVDAGQSVTIEEGRGIAGSEPYRDREP
jgi:hypothetical protein